MNPQLVSILIPAFNAERWIGKCVESALAQTWSRKEIIVVDDGSKDRTSEIAASFRSRRVKAVTRHNQGASAARNHALSLAQGDYIQWLDSDDVLVPDKVATQMKEAEPGHSSRTLLSGAWGKFYDDPGKTSFAPSPLWEDLKPAEWLCRKLDQNLWMAIESWLVSRKLTEMAGPWNEYLSLDDDGEYFSRVVCCSQTIRFLPAARSCVRIGKAGISSGRLTEKKLTSQFTSIRLHVERLLSMEDSPRTRNACLKFLQRWSIYFYPERMDLFEPLRLLARDLGGQLNAPTLSLKYRWIQKLFGWKIAKRAQCTFRAVRFKALRT